MQVIRNQINCFVLSLLILFISLDKTYSEPFKRQPSQTEIAYVWEPELILFDLGELKIETFFLMEGVGAPIQGFLIGKDNFSKIEFIMNSSEEWCQERVDKERSICTDLIKKCNDDHEQINKDLRDKIDTQVIEISGNKTQILKLENEIWWWKAGTIGFAATLTSFLVYKSIK